MLYVIGASVALLDQAIKWFITTHLHVGQSVTVIPGYLKILYVRNTGAAFSILPHQTALLIVIAVVVITAVAIMGRRLAHGRRSVQVALGLLLGGALGNLIDRVVRGYVVDYVDISKIDFPVFNLADAAVCVGVVWLVCFGLFSPSLRSERRDRDADGK
jgi:signal peptidase II